MRNLAAAARVGSAFLSWYLLQPPVLPDGEVEVGAPLADWVANGTFATEQACESTRSANRAALEWALSKNGGGGNGAAVIRQQRCLSLEKLRQLLGTPPASDDDD